jgi:arylsulfatase A
VAINDPALTGADAVFARLWIDDALYIPRFAVLPEGTTTGTVSMTAGEGSFDPRTVEYNFEAVTPGGHSSGWQRNRLYIDSGLEPGSNYTYHVMLRQTETNGTPVVDSETGWSRSASASTPASGVRPNIIVFMADDLGWECFDIYGESDHNTPYISRMAAEGIKFANFHSQPLCTPSRVQIMSGQYNHRNYTTFGNYVPDKSFATFFRQAGYKTCISGKWQLDYRDRTASYVPRRPHALGFDEWLLWNVDQQGSRYWNPVLVTTTPSNGFNYVTTTEEDYGPDLVNEFMNNFATAAADNGDPFFIYCPLIDPHSPFVIPPDGMGSNTIEHQAMVEYLDKLVGQTLEMIRNHPNMANNTLVFITGDNGTNKGITTQFNGASYAGGKGGTFDPGTHVPAVAWGMKNMVTNTVCDDLVDLTDILATICDVAGVPIDQDYIIDGRSFRSKLLGESRDPRRWVYGWYTNKDGVLQHAWARNKHYKLYETGLPGSRSGNFYDVINDDREVSPLPPPPAGSRLEALKAEFQAVLDRMDADSDPGNN